MGPRTFLFDTNAVRNFFRPRTFATERLHALRERVARLVDDGDIAVVITQPVLWELTAVVTDREFGGRDRYAEALSFYVSLGRRHLMAHEFERMRIELRTRRPVLGKALFRTVDSASVVQTCLSDDWIRQKTESVAEIKRRERLREEPARLRGIDGFTKLAASRGYADWRMMLDEDLAPSVWDATVSSMVKAAMRSRARREKMQIAGHRWPLPRHALTFWAREAFLLAKARHVFVESRKDFTSRKSLQDVPDNLDACHFRDAAYVDVLVTDDATFTAVAKAARTGLRVVTLASFANEIGFV